MSKGLLILTTLFLLSNCKFLNKFSPEMNLFLLQNNFIEAGSSNSSNSSSKDNNKIINVKCFWVNKTNVYQLFNLQKKKEDYTYQPENQKSKIIYNFCQDIVTKVNDESVNSSMIYLNDDGVTYKRLTGTFTSSISSPALVPNVSADTNIFISFSFIFKIIIIKLAISFITFCFTI